MYRIAHHAVAPGPPAYLDHELEKHDLNKPLYYSYPSQWWDRFLKRHGLKDIRLHDLRHTMATLLLESGTDLKKIQKRLRHSVLSTTADTYTHVTKKASKETAEKFDRFDPRSEMRG